MDMELDYEARLWDGVDDPDRFARIWKRVMPEERDDCLIELREPATAPPRPAPRAEQEARAARPGARAKHPMAPFLRVQIEAELQEWQDCLALSRQTGGQLGRMAAQELTHARQLSDAYFLVSGIRFWPVNGVRPGQGGGRAALGERLQAEQEREACYRRAAEEAGEDDRLRTLFARLAQEEAAHAAQIRRLMERRRH